MVVGAVELLSRGFMNTLSSTEIRGREALEEAFARPEGQGLITVSNHSSALDDPLLLATIMPPGSPPEAHRWGGALEPPPLPLSLLMILASVLAQTVHICRFQCLTLISRSKGFRWGEFICPPPFPPAGPNIPTSLSTLF